MRLPIARWLGHHAIPAGFGSCAVFERQRSPGTLRSFAATLWTALLAAVDAPAAKLVVAP